MAKIDPLIDEKEVAEAMEESFQSCLDDGSLEEIGRKLVGPTSSPKMQKTGKKWNDGRVKMERILQEVNADPLTSDEERRNACQNSGRLELEH